VAPAHRGSITPPPPIPPTVIKGVKKAIANLLSKPQALRSNPILEDLDNISAKLQAKYKATQTEVEGASDELDEDATSHGTHNSMEASPKGSKGTSGHSQGLNGSGVVSEEEEVDELVSSSIESEPGAWITHSIDNIN